MIFDASAILAHIYGEPGSENVIPYLENGRISAINAAEIASALFKKGFSPEHVRQVIALQNLDIIPFDYDDLFATAELINITQPYGLSLGDRACIALAMRFGQPIITADRIWSKVQDKLDIEIIQIRD